jgi:hypothetical protein
MQLVRPVFASHPFRFGRGPLRVVDEPAAARRELPEELKLFAATFVAGFLFVSILIG